MAVFSSGLSKSSVSFFFSLCLCVTLFLISSRAFPDYPGGTSRQRWLRNLLRREMETQGFDVYEFEWWHFDHGDWQEYPILNATFDALQNKSDQ